MRAARVSIVHVWVSRSSEIGPAPSTNRTCWKAVGAGDCDFGLVRVCAGWPSCRGKKLMHQGTLVRIGKRCTAQSLASPIRLQPVLMCTEQSRCPLSQQRERRPNFWARRYGKATSKATHQQWSNPQDGATSWCLCATIQLHGAPELRRHDCLR